MRLREIYKSKPVKYTIYRGEKPAAFHDSGIPMGTEMPRKAFMHGVPSKLINHIMDKLENEVPSEKFYTELEEGLPAKIATAAGISLAGDVVAKGVKKIAKKIKDDPKDADEELEEAEEDPWDRHMRQMAPINKAKGHLPYVNADPINKAKGLNKCVDCGRMEKDCECPGHDHANEELEEAPMGPLAKAAATAGAVAGLAGGVAADPGAIPGAEPQANPEYNAPATGDDYVRPEIDKKAAEDLAYSIVSKLGYNANYTYSPRGYKAFVQDVSNWGVTVKVYYKGTLGFQNKAEVKLYMDLKGRLDSASVVVDGKIIKDHPEFKNYIGSRISK